MYDFFVQVTSDFLNWITKINLIDISIVIFYIINVGLIIFLLMKGIRLLMRFLKKEK